MDHLLVHTCNSHIQGGTPNLRCIRPKVGVETTESYTSVVPIEERGDDGRIGDPAARRLGDGERFDSGSIDDAGRSGWDA